ncbi:hypothetical protein FRB95_004853 [Tulasnella sp. JGI-2019a]|nr:hypothetical protein FRB95_004853 [Tulasnella sp. JGI-2019a]
MLRLTRISSRSLLAATGGIAGSVAVTNYAAGPIHADEGGPPKPTAVTTTLHVPRSQLSIYPSPPSEIHIVRTESELANRIGVVREYATEQYIKGSDIAQGWVDNWIAVEGKVEKKIKEIIPKDEPMTPGLLYVGVATLTGSVIGRNRIAPIRILIPPTALLASLAYFLPKTFANLSSYTSSLEKAYIPAFQHNRHELQHSVSSSLSSTTQALTKAKDTLGNNSTWARNEIERTTGLKVGRESESGGANLQTALQSIGQQAKDVSARMQEETKKLAGQAGEKVDVLVEEIKTQTLATEDVKDKKEEAFPKRLV